MKKHEKSKKQYDKLLSKILNQPILYIVLLLVVALAYIFGTTDLGSLFSPVSVKTQNTCEIHFIDVGQGDSALVLTENGTVLVDAGTTDSGKDAAAYIKNRTNTIDYMILTHPHEDHIGGASFIMDDVKVKNIIMPDMTANSASFDRLLDAIENNDTNVIPAEKGLGFLVGELRIEILSPPTNKTYEDTNNMSIVSRITFGKTSFLFTGDAEKTVENDLLQSGQTLRSDVLKIGHHGSSTSSCEEFIKAVSPKFAVISCGKDNSYGHPHYEVKNILKKFNIPYYRTDTYGTIVLTSDGNKVYVD